MTRISSGIEGRAARRDAGALRQARAIRARAIRRRVISGALGLFVAAWLVIALVLVSGHDPALAAHKTASATAASSTAPAASSSTSASGQAAATSTSTGTGSSGTVSSGTVSAVTTRQS